MISSNLCRRKDIAESPTLSKASPTYSVIFYFPTFRRTREILLDSLCIEMIIKTAHSPSSVDFCTCDRRNEWVLRLWGLPPQGLITTCQIVPAPQNRTADEWMEQTGPFSPYTFREWWLWMWHKKNCWTGRRQCQQKCSQPGLFTLLKATRTLNSSAFFFTFTAVGTGGNSSACKLPLSWFSFNINLIIWMGCISMTSPTPKIQWPHGWGFWREYILLCPTDLNLLYWRFTGTVEDVMYNQNNVKWKKQ